MSLPATPNGYINERSCGNIIIISMLTMCYVLLISMFRRITQVWCPSAVYNT